MGALELDDLDVMQFHQVGRVIPNHLQAVGGIMHEILDGGAGGTSDHIGDNQPGVVALQDSQVNVILGLKVVVDATQGDVRAFGYLAHGSGVKPQFDEQVQRGRYDMFLGAAAFGIRGICLFHNKYGRTFCFL